jgi:hypothetical protein
VKSRITATPFDKYLVYKTYEVRADVQGESKLFDGGFVYAPGQHSAALAALLLDEDLKPWLVLKSGDTRFARAERGEPYVLDGAVAGRLDKDGLDGEAIVRGELAEEVGGEIVEASFRPLGETLSPTMPRESSEGDLYFLSLVRLTGAPTGDGGDMEAVGLIGPKLIAPEEAWELFSQGQVSDAGRAHALFGRAFHAIGYLPELGVYVHDHPKLLEKYDTLGLGEVQDIRAQGAPQALPERLDPSTLITGVATNRRSEVELPGGAMMIDATVHHTAVSDGETTQVGEDFENQFLALDYDRAKLAFYYRDPNLGPMVRLTAQARPPLMFAPGEPRVVRLDVTDLKVPRRGKRVAELEDARRLGKPAGASSGQSDLYYQLWAREIEELPAGEEPNFVTLAEALRLSRSGHADVQTEALLLRLADGLGWNPNLGMTQDEVRRIVSQAR